MRVQVVDKLAQNPAVISISKNVTTARDTLTDSIAHLRQYSAATLKALPEHKVVKQALEALDRALHALSSLKQTAVEDGHMITDAVTASVATARAIAHDAVVQAKTYVQVRCAWSL